MRDRNLVVGPESEHDLTRLAAIRVPTERVDTPARVGVGPSRQELVEAVLTALEPVVHGQLGDLARHLLDVRVDQFVEIRVPVLVRNSELRSQRVLVRLVELVNG